MTATKLNKNGLKQYNEWVEYIKKLIDDYYIKLSNDIIQNELVINKIEPNFTLTTFSSYFENGVCEKLLFNFDYKGFKCRLYGPLIYVVYG